MPGGVPHTFSLLASEADTEADRTSNDVVNDFAPGVLIRVNLSNTEGTPSYTPEVQAKQPNGDFVTIFTASSTIGANGDFVYILYPGASNSDVTEVAGTAIPYQWRFKLTATTADASNRSDTLVDAQHLS